MEKFRSNQYVILVCLMAISYTTTTRPLDQDVSERKVLSLVSRSLSPSVDLNQINDSFSNVSNTNGSYLPPSWDEFCTLQGEEANSTYNPYYCFIDGTSSGKWNFSVLRKHISSKNVKYSFDVQCQKGAKISLPLAAKGKNIIKLHVRDCMADDYYADFQNPELNSFPDELEEYIMINVIRLIGVKSMFENLQRKSANLPKNVVCGDEETLKVKIERNETFSFINDLDNPERAMEMFRTIGTRNIIDKRMSPHKCFYKKLYLLDVSITTQKDRYYVATLTEQNQFPELKILNISHSTIYYIPQQFKNWWIYFEKLEYLDMSYNLIQDFIFPINYEGIWGSPIPTLTFDLTFNNISRISVRNFERIIQNKKFFIKMAHNPFNCTCTDEMKAVLKYIQETDWTSPKYQRYQYLRDLECQYPGYVKGRRLRDLTLRDINCKFELMPIIVVLSIFSFFLIIFIVVMLKYRREIRILFFTRFNVILPCQPSEMFEEKEFDAFVSYNNDDQEWVCNTFDDNKHERLAHLKFCMHHKDFVPGKTIFENIIRCVENSRHTVIVLSRNFLDSHFCMWEFQEAFQQSIVERKRHLIIILLEDIPDKDLPNDLKRCMKTFTYIRKDDKIFIDKLLYSLSYKGKTLIPPKPAQLNEGYDDFGAPGHKNEDKVEPNNVRNNMIHDINNQIYNIL
ncbi:toll-like receptor 2 type-2 [Ostrea edulis]|uniref:toll-like receptor 2 type-2 n=1 Tax=Ostrea edulis TaxID=37623 RepID=UPI002094B6FB|nr:toll-like receptor 2 type-2 [Ostrea edulis]